MGIYSKDDLYNLINEVDNCMRDIKSAISEKGVDVYEATRLSELADKIRAISQGGDYDTIYNALKGINGEVEPFAFFFNQLSMSPKYDELFYLSLVSNLQNFSASYVGFLYELKVFDSNGNWASVYINADDDRFHWQDYVHLNMNGPALNETFYVWLTDTEEFKRKILSIYGIDVSYISIPMEGLIYDTNGNEYYTTTEISFYGFEEIGQDSDDFNVWFNPWQDSSKFDDIYGFELGTDLDSSLVSGTSVGVDPDMNFTVIDVNGARTEFSSDDIYFPGFFEFSNTNPAIDEQVTVWIPGPADVKQTIKDWFGIDVYSIVAPLYGTVSSTFGASATIIQEMTFTGFGETRDENYLFTEIDGSVDINNIHLPDTDETLEIPVSVSFNSNGPLDLPDGAKYISAPFIKYFNINYGQASYDIEELMANGDEEGMNIFGELQSCISAIPYGQYTNLPYDEEVGLYLIPSDRLERDYSIVGEIQLSNTDYLKEVLSGIGISYINNITIGLCSVFLDADGNPVLFEPGMPQGELTLYPPTPKIQVNSWSGTSFFPGTSENLELHSNVATSEIQLDGYVELPDGSQTDWDNLNSYITVGYAENVGVGDNVAINITRTETINSESFSGQGTIYITGCHYVKDDGSIGNVVFPSPATWTVWFTQPPVIIQSINQNINTAPGNKAKYIVKCTEPSTFDWREIFTGFGLPIYFETAPGQFAGSVNIPLSDVPNYVSPSQTSFEPGETELTITLNGTPNPDDYGYSGYVSTWNVMFKITANSGYSANGNVNTNYTNPDNSGE